MSPVKEFVGHTKGTVDKIHLSSSLILPVSLFQNVVFEAFWTALWCFGVS